MTTRRSGVRSQKSEVVGLRHAKPAAKTRAPRQSEIRNVLRQSRIAV